MENHILLTVQTLKCTDPQLIETSWWNSPSLQIYRQPLCLTRGTALTQMSLLHGQLSEVRIYVLLRMLHILHQNSQFWSLILLYWASVEQGQTISHLSKISARWSKGSHDRTTSQNWKHSLNFQELFYFDSELGRSGKENVLFKVFSFHLSIVGGVSGVDMSQLSSPTKTYFQYYNNYNTCKRVGGSQSDKVSTYSPCGDYGD